MVGAETGGPILVAAASEATKASSLVTLPFSLLFGQGRSDHANFTAAGIPSGFFTDATSWRHSSPRSSRPRISIARLRTAGRSLNLCMAASGRAMR